MGKSNQTKVKEAKAEARNEVLAHLGFKFDNKGVPIPPPGWTLDKDGNPVPPKLPEKPTRTMPPRENLAAKRARRGNDASFSSPSPSDSSTSPSSSGPSPPNLGHSNPSNSGHYARPPAKQPTKAELALVQQKAIHDKKKGKIDKEMKQMIERVVREKLWRAVKFQNGPEERAKVTELLLDLADMEGFKKDVPADARNRATFIECYEGEVCKALNAHRNYVQGQLLKNAVTPWVEGPGNGKCPSEEQMKALNIRALDPENPDDYALWEWWHLEAMAQAVGFRSGWDTNKRLYVTIGKGAPPNNKRSKYIPCSTEAIAQTIIANNRGRWEETHKLKQSKKWRHIKEFRPTGRVHYKPDGKTLDYDVEEKESQTKGAILYLNDPKYHPIWSKSDGGQGTSDAGWDPEGREFFQETAKANYEARKKKEFHKVEAKMLDKLRAKKGIQGGTPEEEARLKAQSDKRKAQMEKCKDLKAMDYDLSESEFEFEDSGDEAENAGDDDATVGNDPDSSGEAVEENEGAGEEDEGAQE